MNKAARDISFERNAWAAVLAVTVAFLSSFAGRSAQLARS